MRDSCRLRPGLAGLSESISVISLDPDDGDIRGGREENLTLALNWYLGRHVRMTANYVMVDAHRRGDFGTSNIFQLRGQISF